MKNWLVLLAALTVVPAQAATYEPYGMAVLQGTDKVTGHVEKITVPVGGDTRFGNLYVGVRACRKTPPEELPESVAFIMVSEISTEPFTPGMNKNSNPVAKTWFSGWMFASTPSLAALEHPVYDIAVVDCTQPLNSDADDQAAVPPVPSPATNAPTKAALPATVPSRPSAN